MACSGVSIDGSCSETSSGGTSTLQQAYNASSSPQIVLNSALGGLNIQDNATPLGTNLFSIQSNGGGSTYFSVNATSVNVGGKLNVTGLIDPTGLLLDDQSTAPATPSGSQGLLWVKNTSPTQLYFTDSSNTNYQVSTTGGSSTFSAITLTNTTNQITMGTGNTTVLSAPTPGSNITLSLPSSASDTLVARNTTDTLTNKTLTAPAFTYTT